MSYKISKRHLHVYVCAISYEICKFRRHMDYRKDQPVINKFVVYVMYENPDTYISP